jgi:hypothetical protein
MRHSQAAEVDANYDYFLRHLGEFLTDHAGRYAVLKDRKVVDFFDQPGEAYRFARESIPDGVFSIQEVTDEPIDLGFFSHVAN